MRLCAEEALGLRSCTHICDADIVFASLIAPCCSCHRSLLPFSPSPFRVSCFFRALLSPLFSLLSPFSPLLSLRFVRAAREQGRNKRSQESESERPRDNKGRGQQRKIVPPPSPPIQRCDFPLFLLLYGFFPLSERLYGTAPPRFLSRVLIQRM